MLIFFTFKDYDIDTKLLNLFHFLLLFSCCRAAGKYTCGFCYLQDVKSGFSFDRETAFLISAIWDRSALNICAFPKVLFGS